MISNHNIFSFVNFFYFVYLVQKTYNFDFLMIKSFSFIVLTNFKATRLLTFLS